MCRTCGRNISAQVKHQLAFAVCLSIPPAEFSLTRLQSYEEFGRFARALIDILPRFPSLEDYWPESDWGDVKFTDALDARPCFYGGTVQRICDFIEAFQILHGDASDAVRDMRYARQMQAALLETVPRPVETRPEERVQGIWRCPSRLLGVDQVGTSDSNALRDDGKPHNDTWFANRLAQRARIRQCRDVGRRYSWLGVRLEGKTLPLSLRNGPAVVLDFWSDAKVHIADAMKRLSVFMAQRIEGGAFLLDRCTSSAAAVVPCAP